MGKREGFFNAPDGTELFYQTWERDAEYACLVFHGFGEHSGRYARLVSALSDLPISYYAMDVRGQGRSGGERVYVESFSQFIEDAQCFLDYLTADTEFKRKKLILFGHSLGGAIALQWLSQKANPWIGFVATSPCFQVYGISWTKPARGLVRKLNQIYPHAVITNPVKPRFLFKNEQLMRDYLKDPLIQRKITIHMADEIIRACESIQSMSFNLNVPMFFLASGNDRIVSLSATRHVYEKTAAPIKRLYIYPELYHEILNEEQNNEVVRDLKQCFQTILGGGYENN